MEKIFNDINKNIEYVNSEFNLLLNSDIILRKFSFTINEKSYKAFLICVDGMVNKNAISQFILKPLINFKGNALSKYDVVTLLTENILLENDVKLISDYDEVSSSLLSGACVLFVDTINIAFNIDVRMLNIRSVESPKNEITVKGSQEGFVENLRTNTSIIRRNLNNKNLVIETLTIGKTKNNQCSICYMKNIANSDLVANVKYRLNNIAVDFVNSTTELSEFIKDDIATSLPQFINTERVDNVVSCLLQGRVAIIYNGSPNVLVVPVNLFDFLSSPEDININHMFANMLKIIRTISSIITLLLPGLYISISMYHFEIIPVDLLFSIVSSRANVPFQVIVEIILMEICFEIIREAGLRVPSPLGSTVGIVGALILGQAAVEANIVSPILIIVIAITGITSFAIPNYEFSFHLRINRFLYIVLGYLCGFIGIGMVLFLYFAKLYSLKTFNVPYMSPYFPYNIYNDRGFLNKAPWKRQFLNSYFRTKFRDVQNSKSMKWRN